jgi:hypothetical protein
MVENAIEHYFRNLLKTNYPPDRSPLATSVFAVLAVILAPTALGLRSLPGSLANAPDVFGQIYAVIMVVGSAAVTVGNLWPNRDSGLPLEISGNLVVGCSLVFYAVAVWTNSTSFAQAQIPFAMSLGLAVGGLVRGLQIGLYVWWRASQAKEE